jgi:hypothetical protein
MLIFSKKSQKVKMGDKCDLKIDKIDKYQDKNHKRNKLDKTSKNLKRQYLIKAKIQKNPTFTTYGNVTETEETEKMIQN